MRVYILLAAVLLILLIPSGSSLSAPGVPVAAAGVVGGTSCPTTISFEAYPSAAKHPGVIVVDQCGNRLFDAFQGGECDNFCNGECLEYASRTVECIAGLFEDDQDYLRLDPDGYLTFTSRFGLHVEGQLVRTP